MLSCVWLFATPWTVAHQAPLSMGFPRQGYWSGLPFPSPGNIPDPGIEPISLASPRWQTDSLPLCHWEAVFYCITSGISHLFTSLSGPSRWLSFYTPSQMQRNFCWLSNFLLTNVWRGLFYFFKKIFKVLEDFKVLFNTFNNFKNTFLKYFKR